MNNRIEELAGQAKLMAEEDINRQISYNTELKAFAEKFAKLLIDECLELNTEVLGHDEWVYLKNVYREHFEIE